MSDFRLSPDKADGSMATVSESPLPPEVPLERNSPKLGTRRPAHDLPDDWTAACQLPPPTGCRPLEAAREDLHVAYLVAMVLPCEGELIGQVLHRPSDIQPAVGLAESCVHSSHLVVLECFVESELASYPADQSADPLRTPDPCSRS